MKKIKLLLVAGACVVLSACSPQAPTVHTTDKGTQWEWNEGTIVVKTGRFGPFLASSEYPRLKWIGKIVSEKDETLEQILKEK